MIRQLIHFGLIGISALCVHWTVVALLVPLGLVPLLANIVAFVIAFQVSYWGHRRWTFAAYTLSHAQTLPRFMAVSGLSFVLNEFLYFLLLEYTALDYRVALFIVLATVAALTFLLSRQWAFRQA